MSYEAGWKALNMEFSEKVPRTEYSVQKHWSLIKKVTGIDTDVLENRYKASLEFEKKWGMDMKWHIRVGPTYMSKGRRTDIGHAVFSESETGKSDLRKTVTNPFSNIEDIYNIDMYKEYGEFDEKQLIKEFEEDYNLLQEKFPTMMNMGGVYITMFSGFIEMFGWENFLLAMGMDAERFAIVVEKYYEWVKQFYHAYAKTNIPVIMSHDDICWTSGPATNPEWYRKFIFPSYKKLWQPLKDAGKKIIFTSDGNYTEFFDDVVDCGADMLVMEPSCDMQLFADKYGKTHGFVGNADCRILLSGTKDDIYNEVKRCMDIGKKYPGFIFATGNHIPSNTPVENAIYYNDAYESMKNR